MIRGTGIRKAFRAALAALYVAALLAVPFGMAYAGPKEERKGRPSYCEITSKGDKAALKKCLEAEEKAKARLRGRSMDSKDEAYCKRATGGSFVLLEKCIKSRESYKERKRKGADRRAPGGVKPAAERPKKPEATESKRSERKSCDRPELPNCGN